MAKIDLRFIVPAEVGPRSLGEDFTSEVEKIFSRHVGHIFNEDAWNQISAEVDALRHKWLDQNAGFVAHGEVIINYDGYRVRVWAKVMTVEEKAARDQLIRDREELIAELEAHQAELDAHTDRRHASMIRNLRKLMRRHADDRSPAIMSIWDTLSDGQKYAIMRDIDYRVRHD
jgi:hypothetical protein